MVSASGLPVTVPVYLFGLPGGFGSNDVIIGHYRNRSLMISAPEGCSAEQIERIGRSVKNSDDRINGVVSFGIPFEMRTDDLTATINRLAEHFYKVQTNAVEFKPVSAFTGEEG
jgi:hypothetical protein